MLELEELDTGEPPEIKKESKKESKTEIFTIQSPFKAMLSLVLNVSAMHIQGNKHRESYRRKNPLEEYFTVVRVIFRSHKLLSLIHLIWILYCLFPRMSFMKKH